MAYSSGDKFSLLTSFLEKTATLDAVGNVDKELTQPSTLPLRALTETSLPASSSSSGATVKRSAPQLQKLPVLEDTVHSSNRPSASLCTSRVTGHALYGISLGLQDEIAKLPISHISARILTSLKENLLTFISGSTGTGKTTQVPQIAAQFVREEFSRLRYWPGQVVVGMPTVVGTTTLFVRVCNEAGLTPGFYAAYRTGTHWEGDDNASISFMTHWYLCCVLENILPKLAVLILDEAQVRTEPLSCIYPFLKRHFARRDCQLRVVIMGVDLEVDVLSKYFATSVGVVHVQGRRFQIERFQCASLGNVSDIDEEVLKRVEDVTCFEMDDNRAVKLIFVKGKKDIEHLVKVLSKKYPNWSVLPCHGDLEKEEMDLVVDLKESARETVIVATNIAETTATIRPVHAVISS